VRQEMRCEPGPREMKRRMAATVHGVVQGVFFRQSTAIEASRLGIAGSVRNEPDGTVRVVAEGDEAALRDLLAWLHHGPERATVERVDVEWCEPRGACGFRIDG
jgi:acylphosphatase